MNNRLRNQLRYAYDLKGYSQECNINRLICMITVFTLGVDRIDIPLQKHCGKCRNGVEEKVNGIPIIFFSCLKNNLTFLR